MHSLASATGSVGGQATLPELAGLSMPAPQPPEGRPPTPAPQPPEGRPPCLFHSLFHSHWMADTPVCSVGVRWQDFQPCSTAVRRRNLQACSMPPGLCLLHLPPWPPEPPGHCLLQLLPRPPESPGHHRCQPSARPSELFGHTSLPASCQANS